MEEAAAVGVKSFQFLSSGDGPPVRMTIVPLGKFPKDMSEVAFLRGRGVSYCVAVWDWGLKIG